MYICEMIRQSNEIFCSTIRNWAITAHAFSHVNKFEISAKNKTVPANFNLLCEGQKGHNTGQKGHNTGQKGLLRVKRDKTRPFRTKGQEGHLYSAVFFPELAWNTRVLLNRKVMFSLWNWTIITFFLKYLILRKIYKLSK